MGAAMKKVVTTPSVEVALRTLDDDNRRRMQAWFGQLANWDGDDFVRTHSHRLDSIPGVYVLKTNTDFRIFFTIHGNTVTIIHITRKQSILAFADSPEAE
jgi:mRNA-degrading endonuclease RelE of RelBE toxin-antitoxin system